MYVSQKIFPVLILAMVMMGAHSINNLKPVKYLDELADQQIMVQKSQKSLGPGTNTSEPEQQDKQEVFDVRLDTDKNNDIQISQVGTKTVKKIEDLSSLKDEKGFEQIQIPQNYVLMKLSERIDYMQKIYVIYYEKLCNHMRSYQKQKFLFPVLLMFFAALFYFSINAINNAFQQRHSQFYEKLSSQHMPVKQYQESNSLTNNFLLNNSILYSQTESSFMSNRNFSMTHEFGKHHEKNQDKKPKYLIHNFKPEFKNISFFQESSIEQSHIVEDDPENSSKSLDTYIAKIQEKNGVKIDKKQLKNGMNDFATANCTRSSNCVQQVKCSDTSDEEYYDIENSGQTFKRYKSEEEDYYSIM